MVKQGHVGNPELLATLFISQSMLFFYSLPTVLVQKAATGAWLLNVFVNTTGILLFLPLYFLLKRFPGLSIIEIAAEVLGKVAGLAVSATMSLFFLYSFVTFTRAYAIATITTLFNRTPVNAVLAVTVITCGIVAYLGLEALTRTTLIFVPFIAFGSALTLFLALEKSDWSGVYPLLGVPLSQHFLAAVNLAPIVNLTLFIGVFSPYLRHGKGSLNLVFWAIAGAGILTTFTEIVIEVMFPYPGIKLLPYPLYQVVRMVHIGPFLQRLEALFVLDAGVTSLLYNAMYLLAAVLAMSQGLKLVDWRPLIFPMGILGFSLATLLYSGSDLAKWGYSWTSSLIYLLISSGLPLFIYLVSIFRGKRGGQGGQQDY